MVVGEVRLTGKTALTFEVESGNLEKKTLIGYPSAVAVSDEAGTVVPVSWGTAAIVCCATVEVEL